MTSVRLPTRQGTIELFEFAGHDLPKPPTTPPTTRQVFAAAHVVADPLADPVGTDAVDWDATLAYRRYLWSLGFGVAEAMDTAQRGGGLKTEHVRTLIAKSVEDSLAEGGRVASGINTDELQGSAATLDAVAEAYLSQMYFIQELGGSVVMMASRHLAALARGPDDYAGVYGRVLAEADKPVILHWLGPQFDPALEGYWGNTDPHSAMETLLAIVRDNSSRVDGVKISMLDADLEISFRNKLPRGVRCYTGDDFNYPSLIAGDHTGHSDALLGIFDAIAPVAMAALHSLDAGDLTTYHHLLNPTVSLSRHVFGEPTYDYKTGLVFLAYLSGHQAHFRMIGGREGARSIVHLAETVRLADAARLFEDPEDVVRRLRPILLGAGVD